MAASTLLDVISAALTAIGQLGQGQTANAEDGAQGLRQSNLFLDQKSADRLFLYTVTPVVVALTPGTQDYTFGPVSATFNGPRPTFVESCQVNPAGTGLWLPVSILDKTKWDAIRNRNASADIPDALWPEYTFPNIGLHFNPRPTGAPNVSMGFWEELTQFVTVQDPVALPPAYEEWLESNLAIRLAPFYDQPVPPNLMQRAQIAEAAVMKINAQGMGGAISANQKFDTPNVGQPILPGGPPPPAAA